MYLLQIFVDIENILVVLKLTKDHGGGTISLPPGNDSRDGTLVSDNPVQMSLRFDDFEKYL